MYRSRHGFSWSVRPVRCQLPDFLPPFSAVGTTVGLHIAAVHGDRRRDPLARRQFLEYPLPMILARPTVEAVVNCRRRAVLGGTVLPSAPTFQHVDDPADDPTVVNPSRSRTVLRKVRLNHRPGILIQPENFPHPFAPKRVPTPWNHKLSPNSRL